MIHIELADKNKSTKYLSQKNIKIHNHKIN
jgi:hypothetical protein